MDPALVDLAAWLTTERPRFVSLVEEGSTVTGDPWQEGFSDHDITIVIADGLDEESIAVSSWLAAHPFGDEYLFGPRIEGEFLTGDTINDLSLKFRSRAVVGKDVVAEKAAPSRDIARDLGVRGLQQLEMRCIRRRLNLAHWSPEHARKKNYEIFKYFFVFYAAKIYGETGEYPVRRADVAARLPHREGAALLLEAVNDVARVSLEHQRTAFDAAIAHIRAL